MAVKKFKKIMAANRGEIAIRQSRHHAHTFRKLDQAKQIWRPFLQRWGWRSVDQGAGIYDAVARNLLPFQVK